MSDIHDKPLVDLIIGKAVKDAEDQRYVREAGRDVVYVIEIDPTKLSTNFEDWIEKDLLKLNSWDLQQVANQGLLGRAAVVMTSRRKLGAWTIDWDPRCGNDAGVQRQRFEVDSGEAAEVRRNRRRRPYVDFKLAEDEELNNETLNGLKTALDDLQIVDVVRKPQGLSDDLKAGADFMNNAKRCKTSSRRASRLPRRPEVAERRRSSPATAKSSPP